MCARASGSPSRTGAIAPRDHEIAANLGRFAHKNRKKSQKIEADFEAYLLMIKELWKLFGFKSV
jgi:hypothetical protein